MTKYEKKKKSKRRIPCLFIRTDKSCDTEILAGGCIVFPNPTCTKKELDITPIIVKKKSLYSHKCGSLFIVP